MDSPSMPLTKGNLAILGAQCPPLKGPSRGVQFIESWLNDVVLADDDEPASLTPRDVLNDYLFRTIIDMGPTRSGAHHHMKLSIIKQPEQVIHHSPASASYALMSGTLAKIFDGVFFVPDAARERQARLMKFNFLISPMRDNGVKTQADLDTAKQFLRCTQTGTPRFLFRGLYSQSGGGGDPRLNSPQGVTPHAFLNGMEPTSIWDIKNLSEMINKHLDGNTSINSAFSSWSHCMLTAARFARCLGTSTIAILDTASLRDHVYFSEDLWRAGLADTSYEDGYIIYGPISGPNYHTVSITDPCLITRASEINAGSFNAFGQERISSIERGAVESSREIATFLQPQGTSSENILILTARFVGVRVARTQPEQEYLRCDDMHGFLYYTRDDLQALAIRHDATEISLVEATMDTSFYRGLEIEVQLQ